jgi:hypothetical protein
MQVGLDPIIKAKKLTVCRTLVVHVAEISVVANYYVYFYSDWHMDNQPSISWLGYSSMHVHVNLQTSPYECNSYEVD